MDRRTFITRLSASAVAANIVTATSAQELHSVQPAHELQSDDGATVHPFDSNTMKGFPPKLEHQVTTSNYMANADYARWALQRLDELFPTQLVRRGQGPLFVIPRRPRDINELTILSPGGMTITLREQMTELNINAFLAISDGAIISEQYFSGMTPHTPHMLFSCVKSIIATVIATLLEDGDIQEDHPVDEYVPELKESGYAGATVRQLLDMRSGIDWSVTSWGPYMDALGPAAAEKNLPVGVYNFIPSMKRTGDGEPRGVYKNADPEVLTWVAEKVTGTRFADLLSQRLWSKLGMEHDARVACDQLGHWTGLIAMTARDFARWGLLCLNEGVHQGQQLVPKRFFRDIRENASTDLDLLQNDTSSEKTAYRSYFYLSPDKSAISAGGHLGQHCSINYRDKTVMIWYASFHPDDRLAAQISALADTTEQISCAIASH